MFCLTQFLTLYFVALGIVPRLDRKDAMASLSRPSAVLVWGSWLKAIGPPEAEFLTDQPPQIFGITTSATKIAMYTPIMM